VTATITSVVHLLAQLPDAERGHDGDHIAKTPGLRWWPVGTLWERLSEDRRAGR
jgi:hypothetical protein